MISCKAFVLLPIIPHIQNKIENNMYITKNLIKTNLKRMRNICKNLYTAKSYMYLQELALKDSRGSFEVALCEASQLVALI